MEAKKVGLFIAKLRKEKRLTQLELADLIGVTDSAISRWERGEGFPEISVVPKLASLLGVTTDELLNGDYQTISKSPSYANKFKMFALISVIIIAFGYVLGMILQYVIGRYWPLAVFSASFMVVGIVLYIIMRMLFIEKSEFSSDEKKLLFTRDRLIINFCIIIFLLVLPIYIIKQKLITEDGKTIFYAMLGFFNYLEFAIIFLCIGLFLITITNMIHEHFLYDNQNKRHYIATIGTQAILSVISLLLLIAALYPDLAEQISVVIAGGLVVLAILGLIGKKVSILELIFTIAIVGVIFSIFFVFADKNIDGMALIIVIAVPVIVAFITYFKAIKNKKLLSYKVLLVTNLIVCLFYAIMSIELPQLDYDTIYVLTTLFVLAITVYNNIFIRMKNKDICIIR